jgi:pilus assembly protein Flp/PilA
MFAHLHHALALLRQDQRAVTAIEYALIAALIAVVIVGAATQLGSTVSSTFNSVASEL